MTEKQTIEILHNICSDICDLCNGEGYTEHQYKPKMIQDGWE